MQAMALEGPKQPLRLRQRPCLTRLPAKFGCACWHARCAMT